MINEQDIFNAAAALPEAEREPYLDKACSGQPELRDRVEALVLSHKVSGFMQDGTVMLPVSPAEQSGERIGRYRLLQQIGEGGFGVVWMAEQIEPVTRRVALKIIKAGMDTKEVIARFEAERQALAMMDHPNIARVFDAGATEWGRPFFVMELVKGVPITKFCDERQFTTRQRLELFADVCSAINHAHQKGVIHRDIKPSNVMVTLHGDTPVPKVIDFGIAKATHGKLTDATLFTRFEQFVGTPAYMSPEQTSLSSLDIDTRSDIYALGILLYELLTGKPPFDAKTLLSAGYEEMSRIIREVEPPKPSSRLSTVAGDTRTALAKARGMAPENLGRLVEPDLDWIVMKAIEKDRARRYDTANGLALDIRRFLADEPVSARPPTTGYRFRKFARRHKAGMRVAAGVAALLMCATVGSISLAIRAHNAEEKATRKALDESAARAEAEAARADAEAAANFLYTVFGRAQPLQKGPGLTVVDCLSEALVKLKTELAGHPEPKYKMQRAMAWVLHNAGRTSEVIPYAEESRDYYTRTRPPEHLEVLRANHSVARYYMGVKRWEEAKELLERNYRIEERILPPEHSESPELSMTMSNLSACYFALGRKDEALQLREKALEYTRSGRIDSDRPSLVWAQEALAASYVDKERWEDALKLQKETLEYYRNAGESEPLINSLERTAQSYSAAGCEPDALRLRTEAQNIRDTMGAVGFTRDEFKRAAQRIASLLAAQRFDEAIEASRELVRTQPPQAGLIFEEGEQRTAKASAAGNFNDDFKALGVPDGVKPLSLVVPGHASEAEAWLANALLLQVSRGGGREDPQLAAESSREASGIVERLRSLKPDHNGRMHQVDLFMRYGNWKEAAVLARPLYEEFQGTAWTAFRLGPLLIKTGNFSAHAELCHKLLLPFASAKPEELEPLLDSVNKKNPGHTFDIISRVVCLRNPTGEHLKWATILADRAAKLEGHPHRSWFVLAKGLAAWRSGDFSGTAAILESLIPRVPPEAAASASAVLAMARHRLQEPEAAAKALQRSEELHQLYWFSDQRVSVDQNIHDWLMADILLTEAKSLLATGK